jgi:hypothetical protein
MPALKVVLAVRTGDLHHDPRMRHLLDDTARVTSVTIGDLDPGTVRKALQAVAAVLIAAPGPLRCTGIRAAPSSCCGGRQRLGHHGVHAGYRHTRRRCQLLP